MSRCLNDWCKRCAGASTGVCAQDLADLMGVTGAMISTRYKSTRFKAANNRGLSFTLSLAEFSDLIQSACTYCGAPPANIAKIKDDGRTYRLHYQGVDRVDNARGYEPGNVVSCCQPCNTSKGDRPLSEFLARRAP